MNSATTEIEVAESGGEGEAESSWFGAGATTSTAEVSAVGVSAAKYRPLEIPMNSATTEIEVAESCGEGEASRATCTTTAGRYISRKVCWCCSA